MLKPGIEPGACPWKRHMLPLHHLSIFPQGIEPQSSACKADVLTTTPWKQVPTENRTRIAAFKVLSDSRYTIGTFILLYKYNIISLNN